MMAIDRKTADYWVDWNLSNWAAWQRTGGWPEGVSSASVGSGNLTQDFDDMCLTADRNSAEITDAIISDLQPAERCALQNAYLQVVWTFQREPFSVVLDRAKGNVKDGLRRKGVWLGE